LKNIIKIQGAFNCAIFVGIKMILTFIISVLSLFFLGFYYGKQKNKGKYKYYKVGSFILLFIGDYLFISTIDKVVL